MTKLFYAFFFPMIALIAITAGWHLSEYRAQQYREYAQLEERARAHKTEMRDGILYLQSAIEYTPYRKEVVK